MKVDLFPWQHFSGRLLSAGERTKCTQFPSLGHRCIQPAPSFSAPPTNNIVSVSMIISLFHITISYIIYQATTDQQYCQCLYYYLIIVYHYIIYNISGNHQPTTSSVSLTSTSATTLLSPHPHFCMMYSMMVK